MKKFIVCAIILIAASLTEPILVYGQSHTHPDYLKSLPENLELKEDTPYKYLMTAEYINRDIYGNPGSKTKVIGEYTRGMENGYVGWNNVFIGHDNYPFESSPDMIKQEYMEDLSYLPSSDLVEEAFFNNFPSNIDNTFSRNLIWDILAIEGNAWNYIDSLELNKTYVVKDAQGGFNMAEIGNYNHEKVELNWLGVSLMNNTLCAIIEYRALDNKLELDLEGIKSKGSELYWGQTWISLNNMQIEHAVMYSNTVQEMEITGMPEKMLISTKRIVTVERIK